MKVLEKIISGDGQRKSRLHDEKGNLIPGRRLLRHGPLAFLTGIGRLIFGYRPVQPWISYSAARVLREHLTGTSRVLEFGSGMSTVWYARHAGEVCSVEDFRPWFDRVSQVLQARRLGNVRYGFAATPEEYSSYMCDDTRGFDLVMVDGSVRADCIRKAAHLVRPGGILYLDNSDKNSSSATMTGDMRLAEALALEFARSRRAEVCYFTDFAPTQLFVQEGMLVRVPKH
ncbi:MAG TPA: hypothetical protein VIL30_23900 [Ramlibacter sp.]